MNSGESENEHREEEEEEEEEEEGEEATNTSPSGIDPRDRVPAYIRATAEFLRVAMPPSKRFLVKRAQDDSNRVLVFREQGVELLHDESKSYECLAFFPWRFVRSLTATDETHQLVFVWRPEDPDDPSSARYVRSRFISSQTKEIKELFSEYIQVLCRKFTNYAGYENWD